MAVWRQSQLVARLVVPAAACLFLASCGSSSAPKPTVGTMTTLRHQRVAAIVNVGGAPGAPDWQAVGFNAVWVANSTKGTVQRIDPNTNRVEDMHDFIGHPCAGLATGFGSVWAVSCTVGQIERIDPRTLHVIKRITAQPADQEGLIATDASGVWVLTNGLPSFIAQLDRINPRTNTITEHVRVPTGSAAVASGFGSEWVTVPTGDTVVRVDPHAGRITATIKVHAGPRFLAAGEGAVWVLNQSDGSVSKIDPSSNHVVATIQVHVPGTGGYITTGLGSVWLSMPGTPLVRIDPGTNRVSERFTGQGGDCVSTGFGSVWLSNHDFGSVWRIRG